MAYKKRSNTGDKDRVGQQPHSQGSYLVFIICQSMVLCSNTLKKVSTSPGNEVG